MIARLALLVLVTSTAACGGSSSPAPAGTTPTVRVAHFPNLTHAVAMVAIASGGLRSSLAPASVEVKTFGTGPQAIEALLAGEVDIAYVGPSPAVNGFVRSRGEALRVIAGASSGGALFVARPEAGIKTPADLAGKRIATPQRGGTQDIALRILAREAGIRTSDEGGTLSVIPTQPADILTAFQRGQIDGAWVAEPWGTRLIQEAGATVWFDERSKWPNERFATTHVVVATTFLEAHPDLVRAFLRAHVDAVQWIGAHPTEAAALANREIARITTAALPPAVLETAFRHVDYTWDPLASTVAVMADNAYALGFLGTSTPDLSAYYALDPLQSVLREKGLPPIDGGTR